MQVKNGVIGLILLLVVFGLCFGYLKYGPRNYVLSETQYPGEAYWSDSDLFVTVQSSGFAHSELKGVKRVPVIGLFLTLFAGDQSSSAPAEVAVYHYSGDSVHRDSDLVELARVFGEHGNVTDLRPSLYAHEVDRAEETTSPCDRRRKPRERSWVIVEANADGGAERG